MSCVLFRAILNPIFVRADTNKYLRSWGNFFNLPRPRYHLYNDKCVFLFLKIVSGWQPPLLEYSGAVDPPLGEDSLLISGGWPRVVSLKD